MTWYNLHGISMRVTAPGAVAASIGRRLLRFHSEAEALPDLDFVFTTDGCIPEISGARRSVYELDGGEVLYYPDTDVLTARFGGAVRMICNVATGRTEYALTPVEEAYRAASHILFTLPLIELLRRRGQFNVHAAALCRGNDAVLLAGPSGAGKSTLTLAMTRAGWDYMGDDMVFLKADCAGLYGFPEGIDVFPEVSGNSGKTHVRPEAAFGATEILHATPRLLLFPRIAHTTESVVTPIDPSEAFLELAPNVLMTDRATCARHFKALGDLTRRTPAFRLHTGTDLREAQRTISDLFW